MKRAGLAYYLHFAADFGRIAFAESVALQSAQEALTSQIIRFQSLSRLTLTLAIRAPAMAKMMLNKSTYSIIA